MPEYVQGASPFLPSMLLLEWWKPMPGFEGLYEISNVGNVKRSSVCRGSSARLLKPQLNRRLGYYYVYPSKGAKNFTRRLHVLVAEAFHGPRPHDLVTDHVNGSKRKNWASNLEYVSQEVNIARSICMGLSDPAFAAARANSPLCEAEIREIRSLVGQVSYAKLAKRFGVCVGSISQIVHHETWKEVV